MKITFLGTNGWYSAKTGNTICTLIETKSHRIILDAGDGLHHLKETTSEKHAYIMLLGHAHLDHIFGLHILPRLKDRISCLDIYVPIEKANALKQFLRPPFVSSVSSLPFPVSIHTLKEGTNTKPFPIICLPLRHMHGAMGFRILVEGKVIAYCSDTGVASNVTALGANADVLIHECSVQGTFRGPWGHVGPVQAAQAAKRAQAKRLVLTHFSANDFLSISERSEALKKAKKIFPRTIAAQDGKYIEV